MATTLCLLPIQKLVARAQRQISVPFLNYYKIHVINEVI